MIDLNSPAMQTFIQIELLVAVIPLSALVLKIVIARVIRSITPKGK